MSKSDATKARIMRAAISAFTALSYRGVTLREVAREAGVTMGAIRYHFGSKADLYRDTLAYLSQPYNTACRSALQAALPSGDARAMIASWLTAPLTHWPKDEIATGEQTLCFLNKMGYESPELTREVYESHYAFALAEWAEAVRSFFPGMRQDDWLWCLTCLRGMYFNLIAHDEFTLWSLPRVQDKLQALRRLSADAVALLLTYTPKSAK